MSPIKLLEEAREKGITELAVTDINNTSGIINILRLAPDYGIKAQVGIDCRNGNTQLYIIIARNMDGFREMNSFLSSVRTTDKVMPNMPPRLENCFVIYPWHKAFDLKLRDNEYVGIYLRDLPNFRLHAREHHYTRAVPLATVTFTDKIGYNINRLLCAIANNTLLSKLTADMHGCNTDTFLNDDAFDDMQAEIPAAFKNAKHIFQSSHIDLQFGTPKNKFTFTGSKGDDLKMLSDIAEKGYKERYPIDSNMIRARMDKELRMIDELNFTAYFLINWDIVQFAKGKGYFHMGRGSGANSIVAYCMRITDVDPIELNLYFERFINPSRKNPPDFDIDFSHTDRDEVRKYIFEKYPDHTALVGSYSAFERRSCIRELGKVFGLPDNDITALQHPEVDIKAQDSIGKTVLHYAGKIHGMPNMLSVHACGILISEEPIVTYTALELFPVGFVSTQFSMLEAEDVGLNKYDILSQRGLGHIKDAVKYIKENKGIEIDIFATEQFKNDPKINELLLRGDTLGCFYVESPAMRQLLRKLLVKDYLGLVAASSVIRPGVASSGMMREYIERYRFPEKRSNANPKLLEIMPDTYGVMVYQEDVIKVANLYGGLTLTESDYLRRAMSGKFRSRKEFWDVKNKFFSNCKAKGYPDEEAAEIWRQMESFAGYAFAKGHSASYAVESYQSLYLRAYYPIEFMTAVINNFGGFYSTEFYLHEARMCGATIALPCINKSNELSVLTGTTIYMGLGLIKDLESKTVQNILAERKRKGPFKNLHNFIIRVPIALDQLRILIRIKAFRFTHIESKELLWEAHSYLTETKKSVPHPELFEEPPEPDDLPELDYSPYEDAIDQRQILGFFHTSPFELVRKKYPALVYADELDRHVGNVVYITGYFIADKLVHTVHGDNMLFGCFIDSKGKVFDTVHFPQSLKHSAFAGRGVYLIKGKVVTDFDVPSIEVSNMQKMEWVF